jgi:hypothetical protein
MSANWRITMKRTQSQKEIDLVFVIFGIMIFILPSILIEGSSYIHTHLLVADIVMICCVFIACFLVFIIYPFIIAYKEKKSHH